MSKEKSYTKEQVRTIINTNLLIKLWAQSKISPHHMSRTQINIIKNFCKKPIPWGKLTGSN